MRLLIIIMTLLLPVCTFGQSKQSKEYYKKGVSLFYSKKYEEAIAYFKKCDSLDKAQLKPSSRNYHRGELAIAECYAFIADSLYDIGSYDEALDLQIVAVDVYKRFLGDNNSDYAIALSNLALYYDEVGNYAESIRLRTNALGIIRKLYGEEHPEYASSLANLATTYFDSGDLYEAIRPATIAMNIRLKSLDENSLDLLSSYNNLASYYWHLGDYSEAIKMSTMAVNLKKKYFGEDSPSYATSLSNLANYYAAIGNYIEAVSYFEIAVNIRKRTLGENHPDYALSLSDVAHCYAIQGDYDEAIKYMNVALDIIKKSLGEENPRYASLLSDLAGYCSLLCRDEAALKYANEALKIYRNIYGENHYQTAGVLDMLASMCFCINKKSEAISYGNMAMQIYLKTYGENHPDYVESLNSLAWYYCSAGMYDEAVDYYKQGYGRTVSFILKNFLWMTYQERSFFWANFCPLFEEELPLAAYLVDRSIENGTAIARSTSDGIASVAYNSMVFSKGLLLNTEQELKKIIGQSSDTALVARYNKLRAARARLDKIYTIPLDERGENADSLSKVIELEESRLVESCKELGNFTKNLSIDWRDIQKNLGDDDLAIEYACFVDDDGIVQYVALILKKGMSSPKFVRLFDSENFVKISDKEYYSTSKLYDLVWKPLAEYLEGVKNVYFSPGGQLHTIAIEYLPGEDGKLFAEKYDAYRLSSTRELAMEHTVNPIRRAVTYGGIQYDFTESDWQNHAEQRKSKLDSVNVAFRDMALTSEKNRDDVTQYLDGTKLESIEVAAVLRAAGYEVVELSDKAATEESLKDLSGSGIKILHIGTHGFNENEEDLEKASSLTFYSSSQHDIEDRSLSCSGLLFAGAHSALNPQKRNDIPDGMDDGILTAKEISRLDFHGLDLVILSACQTGLGEITSDGVFGLQRGFKKAGAQTIVMSLWDVADVTTRLLMVEFFKHLAAGETKRAAFLAAQKTLREKYPNPQYWAAFVMVDGQ